MICPIGVSTDSKGGSGLGVVRESKCHEEGHKHDDGAEEEGRMVTEPPCPVHGQGPHQTAGKRPKDARESGSRFHGPHHAAEFSPILLRVGSDQTRRGRLEDAAAGGDEDARW